MSDAILVLGASGWLGHYVVTELALRSPRRRVLAGYRTWKPERVLSEENVSAIELSAGNPKALLSIEPTAILNLGRGEEEIDFEFHCQLIERANGLSSRYVYASSVNAVDGDVSKPHLETDPQISQTDYGRFKGRCEIELLRNCKRAAAFRFGATHGWSPNRAARTDEFLARLARGETVESDQGVWQNRTFVGDLAKMVSMLIEDDQASGIFHLGSGDASDEVDFLRSLATAFGYDRSRVVPGRVVDWNMVLETKRFQERFPSFRLPTEADAISKIRAQKELSQFLRT